MIKHPLKEALIRMGKDNFNLETMLNTLADIESDDEIKRTKPAKKRLREELLLIHGSYQIEHSNNKSGRRGGGDISGDISGGREDIFNATDFVKNEKTCMSGGRDGDVSDDVCFSCGKCGELVCCDGCPHAFHLLCVGFKSVPDSKWFCNECIQQQQIYSNNNNNII